MSDYASTFAKFSIGFLFGFSFATGLIILSGRTYGDGKSFERAEAIKANVAEYVVNPKTGETAFKYKEKQQCPTSPSCSAKPSD